MRVCPMHTRRRRLWRRGARTIARQYTHCCRFMCPSRAGDPGTHHIADFFVPRVLNTWIAESNSSAFYGYAAYCRSQGLLADVSSTLLEGDVADNVRRLFAEHSYRLANSL